MLGAVQSTILHVLNWASRTIRPTVTIDTFSEFQLRDIGLTRDHESIRARVGDVAVPWHCPAGAHPSNAQASQPPDHAVALRPVAADLQRRKPALNV